MGLKRYEWSAKLALGVVATLGLFGCGGPLDAGQQEEETATVSEAITGGRIGGGQGAVELTIYNVGLPATRCTGALVGDSVVVTAAHCFDKVTGSSDIKDTILSAWVQVRYTQDGSNYYCVSRPDSAGNCPSWSFAWVARHARSTKTDVGNDFAVIWNDTPWEYIYSDSYFRKLWTGHIYTSSSFRQYGRGANDGEGPSIMKYLHDSPDSVSAKHLTTDGGSARACSGDSGGPLLDKSNLRNIFALHSTSVGGVCSDKGEPQRSHRIRTRDINLINIFANCTSDAAGTTTSCF